MKPLDKNKKYDLSQLNDEQLQTVLGWLKKNDSNWSADRLELLLRHKIICFYGCNWVVWHSDKNTTNALELFKEEPNGCEIVVNSMGRVEPKYPNYSCDKSDVYESAHDLIEKGKQHGLKIVVTFEKL